MKTVLVTGGLGFIGSNFITYCLNKYNDYYIINLDALTYAGDLNNVKDIKNNSRYKFINGNICNKNFVEFIFHEYNVQEVIHFAAQTHVDNSIEDPDIFITTNINGTHTLLDIAYNTWMEKPFQYKDEYKNSRFHHISTDEVYGTLGEDDLFSETTPYAPNSPYSASKASADMIVRSYYHTYGLNTITTNCSNNYGPNQHDEKFIPTIIKNAISNKDIPIYGTGNNIRDWLYVLDHCQAVDLAFHRGKDGETYNIGGDNEKSNNNIANIVCAILDNLIPKTKSYKMQLKYVKDRAGHDKRYAINSTKIKNELGWSPKENFDTAIQMTVKWYLQKYKIDL